jgi:hypothetical protein
MNEIYLLSGIAAIIAAVFYIAEYYLVKRDRFLLFAFATFVLVGFGLIIWTLAIGVDPNLILTGENLTQVGWLFVFFAALSFGRLWGTNRMKYFIITKIGIYALIAAILILVPI